MIRKFGATGIESQPQGLDLGLGGGGNIKSIQRGSLVPWNNTAVTLDIAISAVDPTKSIVIIMCDKNGNPPSIIVTSGKIIDSTTLRLSRVTGTANASTTVSWQVIEFNNVKSLQSGVSTSLSTITIATVNPLKSIVFLSNTSSSTTTGSQYNDTTLTLTNATTLALSATGGFITTYWQVIEFI